MSWLDLGETPRASESWDGQIKEAGACAACKTEAPFAMERDDKHKARWRELLAVVRQRAARREEDLLARLHQVEKSLEAEVANRPERVVEKWRNQEVIDKAEAEAERAFRSREKAWQAMCEVRLLHREAQQGQCRCGKRADRCPELAIVGSYPGILEWEREQIRRLQDHLPHALPRNHPVCLDPRLLRNYDESGNELGDATEADAG